MDQNNHQYSTGSTRPKKEHNGLVAFLLICVIFLGGLVSVLSFMNVQLFRRLNEAEKTANVSFHQADSAPADTRAEMTPASVEFGGMTLLEISTQYRNLYSLPQGLYVAHIAPGSQAESFGIAAGDLLVAVNSENISSLEELQTLQWPADLTFYRDGQENTYPFSLGES